MSAAVWNEPPEIRERPGPCAECKRLRHARMAAAVLGDSMMHRRVAAEIAAHRIQDHGQVA